MNVQLLVYDGFRERDAFGALEVLHLAAASGADLRMGLVRVGNATVTSAYGLQLHVPAHLDPLHPPGILILPGSGWTSDARDDGSADSLRQRIAQTLAGLADAGTTIAATGSGILLLGRADQLANRSVTGPDALAEDLRRAGAEVVSARVVDDGNIITATGATAGLDIALALVERFAGPAIAISVERRLGYERPGTVWRRRTSGVHTSKG
jgi:transcriptional regulator GlxA family with amidase domain